MQRATVAKSALVLLFLPLAPRLGAQVVDEIRTANASGEPGQVVEVEVTASFSHPAYWFDIGIQWDAERLAFRGWTAEGTGSQGSDPLLQHWSEL